MKMTAELALKAQKKACCSEASWKEVSGNNIGREAGKLYVAFCQR